MLPKCGQARQQVKQTLELTFLPLYSSRSRSRVWASGDGGSQHLGNRTGVCPKVVSGGLSREGLCTVAMFLQLYSKIVSGMFVLADGGCIRGSMQAGNGPYHVYLQRHYKYLGIYLFRSSMPCLLLPPLIRGPQSKIHSLVISSFLGVLALAA